MSKKDKANLLSILDATDKILKYVQGTNSAEDYYQNSLVFDAILMNFLVIGEMVDRISPELKSKHSDVDWQKIKGFRNIVAHDSVGVCFNPYSMLIHTHLTDLRIRIRNILTSMSNNKT